MKAGQAVPVQPMYDEFSVRSLLRRRVTCIRFGNVVQITDMKPKSLSLSAEPDDLHAPWPH